MIRSTLCGNHRKEREEDAKGQPPGQDESCRLKMGNFSSWAQFNVRRVRPTGQKDREHPGHEDRNGKT